MNRGSQLTVASLFSGVLGLDLGFEEAGFDLRVCVELDPSAVSTIKANMPQTSVLAKDVRRVRGEDILKAAGLDVGALTVLTGGPPCTPFSYAGKRRSLEDPRADLVVEFARLVSEVQPEFFVFENVAGLVNAAKKHIPFDDRVARDPKELNAKERLGSAYASILAKFKRTGYGISEDVVDAANYGAAQHRRRVIILGSRDGSSIPLPVPTHGNPRSPDVLAGERNPWISLREAIGAKQPETKQDQIAFPSWGEFLRYVPEGGCWRDLPEDVKIEAMGGAYYSSGGRTGFFRRLSWDRPAPTLVTSPVMKATCLCHPSEDRPLSVSEYSRIQGFPPDWMVEGSTSTKYRLIGQAVPVPLSRAIAGAILACVEARQPVPARIST